MTAPQQIIALTASELDALHGAGPLAIAVYLHLRLWMDYRTGEAGRTRPISLAMLATYSETHTAKGQGFQIEQPSTQAIRTALDRLTRCGLLRRLAGDRLAFALPQALTASARPFQTQHEPNAEKSTELNTPNPAPVLTMPAEPNSGKPCEVRPNSTHFMIHEIQNPTAPAVDNFAPPRTAEKAGFAEGDRGRLAALARKRGIEARPGETWQDFQRRVVADQRGGIRA